jgi:lipoprotein-anchoring transpeptidase ErfK/SrfK
VQIFLDTEFFCPGKLDGLPGEFTDKAVGLFQRAHGLDETGTYHNLPIPSDTRLYAEYTLRPEDRKYVGSLPSRPDEQSKTQYLPYNSYWEFLAERFHCSEGLLQYLNPTLNLEKLKTGDTVKVPAVEPFEIETLKSLASMPERPEFEARKIRINRKERILELVENETLLASVPITPGSSSLPTPAGKWRLLAVSTMPVFRWDEGVLNRGVRTSNFFMLPPGPNNPVGVAWCALNKPGIGIHGTNNPETIGRAHSHGCMRVANWDIARLIQRITSGISVQIE